MAPYGTLRFVDVSFYPSAQGFVTHAHTERNRKQEEASEKALQFQSKEGSIECIVVQASWIDQDQEILLRCTG